MSFLENEAEILKIIETLTTTGQRTLDENLMKKLRGICKLSDEYVNYAYYALMTRLRKEHSEIRYSALQIMNELFCRSSVFRKLLEVDLEEFFELVVETDADKPLPLPLPVAKELKLKALECIQNWCKKFGEKYVRLQLGFTYLKKCKKVDFSDMEARNVAQREHQRQEAERSERVMQEKILKVQNEMQELSAEIKGVACQMENCFRLLVPHPTDFFSPLDFEPSNKCGNDDHSIEIEEELSSETSKMDSTPFDCDSHENSLRHHGLCNMKKAITVEVTDNSIVAVDASEDNLPVIENLHDLYRQIVASYLPTVARWLKIISRGNNCSSILKSAIDLKQLLEANLKKYKDLKIKPCVLSTDKDDEDEDDDDFEEVEEKEGYEYKVQVEPAVSEQSFDQPSCSKSLSMVEAAYLWKLNHHKDDSKDPTSASSTINKLIEKNKKSIKDCESSPTETKLTEEGKSNMKSEMLKKAPVLPYDIDLYHWEDEKPVVPEKVRFDSLHKFWESKDDDDNEEQSEALKEAQIASLRTRKIDFCGKFEPVKWSCRAPLPSGKLCPRKDRYKCPFHGKIVKRDNLGNPIEGLEKKPEVNPETAAPAVPDWQNPELLEDIEAATGINLKIPQKKGKGKKPKTKKKDSGLTKIKNIPATAKERLTKKILKRYKHYAPKLDEMERKKFNDKFGDQWNYY